MTSTTQGRLRAALVLAAALLAPALLPAQEPATPATDATPAVAPAGRQLSLEEALTLAEGAGENVRIASSEIDRAEAQVREARSELLPQLDAAAGYTRTLHSEFQDINFDFGGDSGSSDLSNLPFGQANQYRLGLTLNQSLFTGGRIQAQTRAAKAGVSSAQTTLSSTKADLALQVTGAYFDALLLDRLVNISEVSYEQANRTYELAKLSHQVGNQSEFELLRAQVSRDNVKPTLVQRRANRDLAYARLAQLLDLSPIQPLELTTGFAQFDIWQAKGVALPAATDRAAWLEQITEQRAPVRQARLALEAQQEQVKIARAERLPSLGLSSDYGRVAYPIGGLPSWADTRTNWTVALGVHVPVFTGGRLAAQEASQRAAADQASERLRLVREQSWLDARDALDQLDAAQAVWESTMGTIEQAQRAYDIAELRYREGLSTQLELNDTRIALTFTQGNAALAARNVQVARARVALLPDLTLFSGASSTLSAGAAGAGNSPAAPQATAPAVGLPNALFTSSGGSF